MTAWWRKGTAGPAAAVPGGQAGPHEKWSLDRDF
jgi:hypothetical protein